MTENQEMPGPGEEPGLPAETLSAPNPAASAPTMVNLASSWIGMEVRNQKNQQLGHIKDVVFDLKTEQVSYAVLSTGPKLVQRILNEKLVPEKLLAVPLNAFTPGPKDQYLILQADRSQIETATGFQDDHWPSVNNASWGAQPFWQNPGGINSTNTPEVAPEMDMLESD